MVRRVIVMRHYEDTSEDVWETSQRFAAALNERRIRPSHIIASTDRRSQRTRHLLAALLTDVKHDYTEVALDEGTDTAWDTIVSNITSEKHIPIVIVDERTANTLLNKVGHCRTNWLQTPGCCGIVYVNHQGERKGDIELLNPHL